jgi:hypothetical protein
MRIIIFGMYQAELIISHAVHIAWYDALEGLTALPIH